MKYAAIIQARLKSTRLPDKAMLDLCGKPMLAHVIDAVQKAVPVIVATPDKEIADFSVKYGVLAYIGSEDDVLDRYYQAAKHYQVENIVRVTSDNPLISPDLITKLVNHHKIYPGLDYVSNCRLKTTYPIGMDAELVTFKALERAWRETKEPYDREHVTPYIYHHPGLFKLHIFENDIDLSFIRLTVDTAEDLENVRKLMCQTSTK